MHGITTEIVNDQVSHSYKTTGIIHNTFYKFVTTHRMASIQKKKPLHNLQDCLFVYSQNKFLKIL